MLLFDDDDDEEEEEDGFSFGAVGVKQPILLLFAPTWDYSGGPPRYASLYFGDDDVCDEDG